METLTTSIIIVLYLVLLFGVSDLLRAKHTQFSYVIFW